jgi:hypothetical protein
MVVGIGVVIFASVVMMVLTSVSDDAIASLGTAALGIFGTHVGHVSGHSLGRDDRLLGGGVSQRPK